MHEITINSPSWTEAEREKEEDEGRKREEGGSEGRKEGSLRAGARVHPIETSIVLTCRLKEKKESIWKQSDCRMPKPPRSFSLSFCLSVFLSVCLSVFLSSARFWPPVSSVSEFNTELRKGANFSELVRWLPVYRPAAVYACSMDRWLTLADSMEESQDRPRRAALTTSFLQRHAFLLPWL